MGGPTQPMEFSKIGNETDSTQNLEGCEDTKIRRSPELVLIDKLRHMRLRDLLGYGDFGLDSEIRLYLSIDLF